MQKRQHRNRRIGIKFEAELLRNKIRYTKPEHIIGYLDGNPDFVIPKYKIVIFCHTGFVDKELAKRGWKVFQFSEKEIKEKAIESCAKVLEYIKEIDSQKKYYQFTFIDLFSGIGGFRIPLEELGGKCLGYSKINKKSIETYELNFSHYPNDDEKYLGDITTINKLDIGEIDLVVGGVPCQAWSVAGKMKGFDDPRGKLWEDAIRVVDANKPKAFIFENVKGLFDPRNKSSLDLIVKSLKSIGYILADPKLLNSYDFGVPQNRDRIFIVGFRDDLKLTHSFSYPAPLGKKTKLQDILGSIISNPVSKKKLDIQELYNGKIPFSRNRFQKLDEFNDFFIFCDTRNGHSTIHSWDLVRTTKREKEICMTILRNRRKKKYGPKDGNPLSLENLREFIPNLKREELEKLVAKFILRKIDESYEFTNSKNSSGINGIYRIYLPQSDIFSTLTATGTKDMIALTNIEGNTVEEYKSNFIKEIYRKQPFSPLLFSKFSRRQ